MFRSLLLFTLALTACGETNEADAKPNKDKDEAVEAPAEGEAAAATETDAPVPSGAVWATWSGGEVTEGEVTPVIEGELRSLEMKYMMDVYERKSGILDQMLVKQLIDAEVKATGSADVNALMKVEIEDKALAPTDQEVADFYPQVARQLGGATLDEARPMLIGELTRRNQGKRYGEYVNELKAKYNVDIKLDYPDLPRIEMVVNPDDPFLGNADAPIVVVQWAEYQCPYCGTAGETVEGLMAKYPDQVKVVYKDFPLSFHKRAVPAAMAARCAGDQDKYWEMNKVLLKNQQRLEDVQLKSYAEGLQLDMGAWQTCYDSRKYEGAIMANFEQGQKVGVQATPTFFVNGIMISGAQPVEKFAPLIERELAAKDG